MKLTISTLVFLLLNINLAIRTARSQASPCPVNPEQCVLPNCRCSSATVPDNIPPTEIPQIVTFSFDSAVNVINYPLYQELLTGRTNPNGADASVTFFVSHEYNDYNLTHQLYRQGHEIGMNSITRTASSDYWRNLNETMWMSEIDDQRFQMAHLANISVDDIKGMRAPLLQIGGDAMYSAIHENLTWECTRPTLNIRTPGLWPYTNDFSSIQDCQIAPCPREAYPGLWTFPMIDLLSLGGSPCPMVDQCDPRPTTANETLTLLRTNFLDQYNGNRAPFGVFTTSALLLGPGDEFIQRKEGYKMFLDYLAGLPDVYVVSISKALEWIKSPTPTSAINGFVPWQPTEAKPNYCVFAKSCRYDFQGSERYMMACSSMCPAQYPWLHNPLGVPT